jgi:hypothetical protein
VDIIFGLGLLPILLLFTFVLSILFRFTESFPILLVVIMIVGDSILTYSYYTIGLEFITDIQKFSKGIGISFVFTSFLRALSFLLLGKKRGFV